MESCKQINRPVWAEVDLSAISGNMRRIKSLLRPGVRFCPVIKADGYEHGAVMVGREAVKLGADYLAVALLQEGVALREAGFVEPVLILGPTPPEMSAQVVAQRLTQTVFSLDQAEALSAEARKQGRPAKVHVKVDTGMTRVGLRPEEAAEYCARISSLPGLELEGAFTHFATADSEDKSAARAQFGRFRTALRAIEERGLRLAIRHCANSAATLEMPETHLDMVRPGIILYGLNPTGLPLPEASAVPAPGAPTTPPDLGLPAERPDCNGRWPIRLQPAMSLKARLSMVKEVEAGVAVSYGGTFVTRRRTRIGTIPLGYADGYSRMLSGRAEVLVRGQRVPLIGRICMDQCMADLSAVPGAAAGDEVLLFGGGGGEEAVPADELAALLGTINYEIVCMVGKRVPRLYTFGAAPNNA